MFDRRRFCKCIASFAATACLPAVCGWGWRKRVKGGTVYVPDDYPTINDAIDSVEDTTIIVRPGTYRGALHYRGRGAAVVSEAYAEWKRRGQGEFNGPWNTKIVVALGCNVQQGMGYGDQMCGFAVVSA